jgi:Flp pilus assembly protein TadD
MSDSPRIDELRRRVQMDPASIAFAALAEELRRAGRFEEAIATCTAGLQRHPAYLSAHVTLGRALIEVGQYEEAREELEHVLRVAPENLAAIRGLAEIHHYAGGLPEPRPVSTVASPSAPVPERLESFLAAIVRARDARPSVRG